MSLQLVPSRGVALVSDLKFILVLLILGQDIIEWSEDYSCFINLGAGHY